MNNDDPVRRALEALAADDRSRGARPHVERAVLEAFDRQSAHGQSGRDGRSPWLGRLAAAALFVSVATAGLLYALYPYRWQRPSTVEPTQSAALARSPARPDFSNVVLVDHPVEGDFIQTARVRIPRAYLPLLGVPIIDPDAPGTVDLEILLGEDGRGKPIRVIR